MAMERRGWYSRGYLPHIDIDGASQFITWRQDDALPIAVIARWKEELKELPDDKRKKELASRIEKYCDEGHGSCVLANALAARATETVLLAHHASLYVLHAWVVMPNHIHVLVTPGKQISLGKLTKQLKGASARDVNKAIGQSGILWEADYFDRYMRDDKHYNATLKYIEWNPVKAKLCADPKHWTWSSANPVNRQRLEDLLRQAARTEVRESGAE